jgi:tetratricopeptide (TPR) repeat protein
MRPALPLTQARAALLFCLLGSPALAAVPDASQYQLAASEPGNYLAAIVASADRDADAASVYFREALRQDPRNLDLIERAFAATLVSGDTKDAYGLADRLAARDPTNSLARLALAVRSFSNGQYAGARAQLAAGDAGKARDVTSLLLTGWAYAGAGDLRRALESVDRVNDPAVQVFRDYHAALIADALGDPSEALRRFKLAYAKDSQTLRLVDAYARFLARHNDVAGAKKVYADFSLRTPDHPVVKAALAALSSGKPIAPIVRTPREGAAEALYGLGSAGTRQGDELASLIYLRLALALRPDHEFAAVSVANLLSDMKRGGEAINAYLAVPKTSPLAESARIQAAIEYDGLNETSKGLDLMKQVTADHPDDPEAWSAYGTLQRSAKDFAGAAQSYDKAIALLPNPDKGHWVLYYFRGIAYERIHQWPKAEADFKEALKLYPDQPLVLNYLGYSWVDQGVNLEEALRMLRRAVDLKPTDGYIVDSLGWANYKLGHYDEATRDLERAVDLKPVDPVVNDHLGDAYWRVGRKTEAHFQWNHARDFGPEPDDLKKILLKIKDGLPPPPPAPAPGPAAKASPSPEPTKSGG